MNRSTLDTTDRQAAPDSTSTSEAKADRPSAVPTSATERSTCPRPMPGVSTVERRCLVHLLRMFGDPALELALWNGERISTANRPPVGTIHIHDRRTLWRLLLDPKFQFGEGFTAGRLDIEGDLVDVLNILNRACRQAGPDSRFAQLLAKLLHRKHPTTLAGSRANIHHHYDIGNDFYRRWLDEQLLYTCAYFPDRMMSLEQAQIAKMDLVCRKLRLQPGETVIEAGCGWGALALHMARSYGVSVRAYNISHEQIVYARKRAKSEGLDDRVEFIENDWRNITGGCDAFMSVGMLEHVGPGNYRQLGTVIDRCLSADGRGLIHTIGTTEPRPLDSWIERRIFPGAQPPALSQMTEIVEPHELAILDVENLRLHYAETLRHWLERYEQSVEAVREQFDERFVRMWRLYLAGSISAFETGWLQLYQVVFNRASSNQIAWTRDHLVGR